MSATATATAASASASAATAAIPTISFDFPVVRGEIFLHAFCVQDASDVKVRTTMPDAFSYKHVAATFHSNTVLFGDEPDLKPKGRTIRQRSQCRGGTYLQPTHEYYRGEPATTPKISGEEKDSNSDSDSDTATQNSAAAAAATTTTTESKTKNDDNYDTHGFSYDGVTFGLDVVPSTYAHNADPKVTICAFVPDNVVFGQLNGGWSNALKEAGFKQDRFEDTGEMIWEVHCKTIKASHAAAAASAKKTASSTASTTANNADGSESKEAATPAPTTKKPKPPKKSSWLRKRDVSFRDLERPVATEDQRLRRSFLF